MGIGVELEAQARRLKPEGGERGSPAAQVLRELSLVLEHIDQARRLHARLDQELLTAELEAASECGHLENVLPTGAPILGRLDARVASLQAERRQAQRAVAEQIYQLQRELLVLLGRYELLRPPR